MKKLKPRPSVFAAKRQAQAAARLAVREEIRAEFPGPVRLEVLNRMVRDELKGRGQ